MSEYFRDRKFPWQNFIDLLASEGSHDSRLDLELNIWDSNWINNSGPWSRGERNEPCNLVIIIIFIFIVAIIIISSSMIVIFIAPAWVRLLLAGFHLALGIFFAIIERIYVLSQFGDCLFWSVLFNVCLTLGIHVFQSDLKTHILTSPLKLLTLRAVRRGPWGGRRPVSARINAWICFRTVLICSVFVVASWWAAGA